MDPLKVKIKLKNLHCFDEGDGPGSAEPYLWTVFFKLDGDHAVVTPQLSLKGTSTVISTPGNHGDLGGDNDVDAGDNVTIPAAIGECNLMLNPIPLQTPVGSVKNVGGVAGLLIVLMEEDFTPNDAIAKGHAALNVAVKKGIDQLVPTLGISHQQPTDADINKIKGQIATAVTNAIKSDVSVWDFIGGWGNMDDQIGTGVFMFPQQDLINAGATGMPISIRWKNEGDWQLTGVAVGSKA